MIVYELTQSSYNRLSLSEVTIIDGLECLPWNSSMSGLLDLQVCSTTDRQTGAFPRALPIEVGSRAEYSE